MPKFEGLFNRSTESAEVHDPIQTLRGEIDAFIVLEHKMWREANSPKLQSKREQITSQREVIEANLRSEEPANVEKAYLLLEHLLKGLPVKPHPLSDFAAGIVQDNL